MPARRVRAVPHRVSHGHLTSEAVVRVQQVMGVFARGADQLIGQRAHAPVGELVARALLHVDAARVLEEVRESVARQLEHTRRLFR